MTESEMFDLPFDEYIRYRTDYAIKRAPEIMGAEAIAFFQAMWARQYWFHKCNSPEIN
jgi:hypothetical protein